MSCRKLFVPIVVGLMIAMTSPGTADAGGLLHRLFGKRCCVKAKTCRLACHTKPSCGQPCPPAACMQGPGVISGDPCECARQLVRDLACCDCKHPAGSQPEVNRLCKRLAQLRHDRCLQHPQETRVARCPYCNDENYGCEPDDWECIYNNQYTCEYCLMCQSCTDCEGSCYDCPQCQNQPARRHRRKRCIRSPCRKRRSNPCSPSIV